ncbi:hypothetical protein EBZ39_00350 [bacterium]|nr:hypothetical protein [bacterium]
MVSLNSGEPESTLNWCRNLVETIRDGGVWGIPRSGVIFKIDKKKKCLILTLGSEYNPDFIATRRVFAQIGWDVLTEAEYKEPDDGPHSKTD